MFNICTVEVSLNLTPPDNIRQPLTAQSAYVPLPVDCATNTTLNWVTDIHESISPIPSMSDFHPTTLSQLIFAPTEPTVTPPNGDAATETVPIEPTPAILPLIELNSSDVGSTPSLDGIALASTALTESAPINLAPTTPILLDNCITTAHIDVFVNTPTVYTIPVHPPHDLSGLKSGAQNSWGSINHHLHRFHPPWDHLFSPAEQLQSPPNSYSNLHPRDLFSHSHSYSHLWSQLNPHFQPHSLAQLQPTVYIFQTIQHPHGISPTKPKITKTILFALQLSTEIQKPMSVTQCLCGRNILFIYNPNQSWGSEGTRRRFGRRVRTWKESWDHGRGRSHFLGGIQAWGPCFRDIACRQTIFVVV